VKRFLASLSIAFTVLFAVISPTFAAQSVVITPNTGSPVSSYHVTASGDNLWEYIGISESELNDWITANCQGGFRVVSGNVQGFGFSDSHTDIINQQTTTTNDISDPISIDEDITVPNGGNVTSIRFDLSQVDGASNCADGIYDDLIVPNSAWNIDVHNAYIPPIDPDAQNSINDLTQGLADGPVQGLGTLVPIGAILLISVAILYFVIKKFRGVVRT